MLGHKAALFLIFWESSTLFPVYFPLNSAQVFIFLHILHNDNHAIACLFDNSLSNRCEVISHRGFDFYFLDDIVHFLMYLLVIYFCSSL